MSSLLSADLAAACNALGYYDEKSNKYYADSNTLETVKDLIRYLRRDDENHDIRRQLGETKVLQTDLLPLLKSYWEETHLFDVLLRLIVNLTTPALILWNEELPTEKAQRNHYLQIEGHLQSYKEAFADEAVWAVLSTRLSKILEIDYAERGDENSLIIERILVLIRNILYVPADSMEKRPDNDASIHDQVLWALHQSGMLDIILYITSSTNEQAYYMHILEILCFMLREQRASDLATAAPQRSQIEKIRDEAELLAIRNREVRERQRKAKIYSGSRHSRFGGTFVVKSMKAISDNELIYHKPLNKLDELTFDVDKKKPKTPKNRRPIVSETQERRSAFSVRLFLKEFCVEFLNGAYNTFMYHVKDCLVRARAQAHDESYYLWAMRFFMEFNRCYKFDIKLVSETMSVSTFHYVQQQSENYFDLIRSDKKKLRLWSRRLHLAVLAYRELFFTLNAMDKSPDGTVKDSAKIIKSNIFYVLEYREFILALLVTYDELKMSDVYLKDLIETQHIFLKMFETFCGKDGSLIVQTKSRKKKQKRSKKSAATAPAPPVELDLDSMWDEASPQLSVVLESGRDLTSDVVPFDAASEVPIDDQKAEAMKNIQRKLRAGEYEKAIGLLRAAREVWPENDSFGSHNMPPEEEFLALRDIFLADLGENNPVPATQTQVEDPQDSSDNDDEENEEEEEERRVAETDFKFMDFVKRLAHPKVVRACGLALRAFDKNSVNTNHCIVKLLHRIAFDCKMYVMVFQVSIFMTFQKIYAAKELPQYKELVRFATYIIRRFSQVSETNKKVFMEALFWKSSKEAYEIEHGYLTQHKSSAAARAWTEHEEDELRRLFMEHQQSGNEEDVVDWIVENLVDNTKTRRQVLKKLKEMHLLINYKTKKPGVRSKVPQHWTEEEEVHLQELYEQFKDAYDPLGCIMDRLEVPRPKNRIIEKMLVMGLIQDKKELRKKRSKKGNKSSGARASRSHSVESELSNSSSESESDADDARPSSSLSGPSSSRAKGPTAKKSETRKPTKKTKKKPRSTKVSSAELARLLLTVMDKEMTEALEWLKESFSDALEDFEDGSDESVPLVPIMDYAQTAMENKDFQKLLKGFGIFEPFDEQETYWRIPSHLTVDQLKDFRNLIQQALDKTLSVEEPAGAQPTQTEQNESSDDDDIFEKLRRAAKPKSPEISSYTHTDIEMQETNVEISKEEENAPEHPYEESAVTMNDSEGEDIVMKTSTQKKKSRIVMNDSDDDSQDVPEDKDDTDGQVNQESPKNSRANVFDSDSEEEAVSKEIKRNRSNSDSGSEKPALKRSRLIESDDSD